MAVRNIATSDTLETFRTEFNAEAINFGDIATLNAGLTATTIVGSVNEIYTTAIVGKNQGTNFTNSLLVGHTTTGTLNAATHNTGVGSAALDALTTGDNNTAFGSSAGSTISSGAGNVYLGMDAGKNANGNHNVAIGRQAFLDAAGAGSYWNVAVGFAALSNAGNSVSALANTALGKYSGLGVTTGDYNTLLGSDSGSNITTGSGNIIIGKVDAGSATGDRQLKIAGYDGSTTTTWISGDSSGNVTFPATATATSFSGSGAALTGITGLANNAVTEAKIVDNAVTQAKIADDAVGYDELENIQTLILYASAPTTATANCNGAISSSTALVVDGNSGTIAVGMIVSGTGVETTNPPSVITVTDQNNLVLSHTQTIANDVALTFTQSLKILRTAGDA